MHWTFTVWFFQTCFDVIQYWALPFHTSLNGLDLYSRSHLHEKTSLGSFFHKFLHWLGWNLVCCHHLFICWSVEAHAKFRERIILFLWWFLRICLWHSVSAAMCTNQFHLKLVWWQMPLTSAIWYPFDWNWAVSQRVMRKLELLQSFSCKRNETAKSYGMVDYINGEDYKEVLYGNYGSFEQLLLLSFIIFSFWFVFVWLFVCCCCFFFFFFIKTGNKWICVFINNETVASCLLWCKIFCYYYVKSLDNRKWYPGSFTHHDLIIWYAHSTVWTTVGHKYSEVYKPDLSVCNVVECMGVWCQESAARHLNSAALDRRYLRNCASKTKA